MVTHRSSTIVEMFDVVSGKRLAKQELNSATAIMIARMVQLTPKQVRRALESEAILKSYTMLFRKAA